MSMPDSARDARDAAEAIGARYDDLDDGNGYLFRIPRGPRFVLGGGGTICTCPVNSAPAYTVSRDKAHTKAVLKAAKLPVIPGELFFAHAAALDCARRAARRRTRCVSPGASAIRCSANPTTAHAARSPRSSPARQRSMTTFIVWPSTSSHS
jgi:hypothetical protein